MLDGLRVLIAEDSWHIAYGLRSTVRSAGGVVIGPASSIEDVAALINANTIDAAIMDLDLHEESTAPLVLKLVERGVKVVLATGYDVPPELLPVVHAALGKPVSPENLIEALLRPMAPRR